MATKLSSLHARQERRTLLLSRKPERRKQERRHPDLSWIPLFRGADQEAVREALATCEVLQLPEGYQLLVPGETNQNIYIPLTGKVFAHLSIGAGGHAGIALPPGECVGELSAIDGKPVSALVVAGSDIRVLKIPSGIFWDKLMTLPSIARNLRLTLSERLRSTNEIALKAQREQLELIHLRKELDVARQLQSSMLPLQRPLFGERSDIELSGFMEPASTIGGDLFDAFFVHEHILFFCIGDVSGHGVASALFMARVIGLLRLLAISTNQPDVLLKELNDRLSSGNDANIFVTLFCGFYDVRSGVLQYSNGGHCAPMLRTRAGVSHIAIPKGPLIGAFEGVGFGCMQLVLQAGDLLFCYTDGVTEAQTPGGEEFSEARCLDLLRAKHALSIPKLLDSFRTEVARFTGSQLLDDDCTMLALRRLHAVRA
jgi:sigma-B regulation protein RsbU (phosphoserine phosphatase)